MFEEAGTKSSQIQQLCTLHNTTKKELITIKLLIHLLLVQGVHVLKGNPVLIKTLSCLGRLASLASHSLSAAQGDYMNKKNQEIFCS